MLHGIQYNCSSFNMLIPLLKKDYFIIAFDFPGHGYSSHFPAGLPLDFNNFVFSVKKVVDYLKWDKFYVIGHSFGGQIGTYFSAIYPQYIELLIVIDSMEPRPVPLSDTVLHLRSTFREFEQVENKIDKGNPPVYSYEEAFKKFQNNSPWTLSTEATKNIMERSIQKYKDGYIFVMDQRLKCTIRPNLTFEQQREIIKNITCPILFLLADQNMERYGTYLKLMYEFNKSRDNCTIIVVNGGHTLPQNYPERISCLIDEFLSSRDITTVLSEV